MSDASFQINETIGLFSKPSAASLLLESLKELFSDREDLGIGWMVHCDAAGDAPEHARKVLGQVVVEKMLGEPGAGDQHVRDFAQEACGFVKHRAGTPVAVEIVQAVSVVINQVCMRSGWWRGGRAEVSRRDFECLGVLVVDPDYKR
jgi:hypothetical protein